MTRLPVRVWLLGSAAALGLLGLVHVRAAPPPQSAWTARELFARAQQSYNRIDAYQCEVMSFARKGDRTQTVRLAFAFKKPGMVRARVLSGSKRGSEVAIRRDGTIRGHQGGLLRGIKITMERDDRRLRDIRGSPVWEADWGSFLAKAETALNSHPVEALVQSGEAGVLKLAVRLDGATGPQRQIYALDASSFLLRGAELFEGDVLVSRVSYDKEKVNPDLPDGYFNM
jgi:outer membrane lipoprotein-sorting protein